MREATPDEAYEFVEGYLRDKADFPWKTASYLCQRLKKRRRLAMRPDEMDALLRRRLARGAVRYSQFPGRQSLDLLWGHIGQVGRLAELWAPEMDREKLSELVGAFDDYEPPAGAQWVFLSHSFVDVDEVRRLKDELEQLGYAVWIAERAILQGESIVEAVQEGLKAADRFALYATRQSLASRWVLKEAGVANGWEKTPTIILDRRQADLVELFERWVEEGWSDALADSFRAAIPDLPADVIQPTELPTLLYSATRDLEPRDRRRVVLHPQTDADRRLAPGARWHKLLAEVFPAAA